MKEIILINDIVQFTVPEKFFVKWAQSFYPMLNFTEKNTTEEIIKIISPYWSKIFLSYIEPHSCDSSEYECDKLDRQIQIYLRFRHI